jgi:hypothetical protein
MKCTNCHRIMDEYNKHGEVCHPDEKGFYEYYCHSCHISIKKIDLKPDGIEIKCTHKWVYDTVIPKESPFINHRTVYHCEKCCETVIKSI